MAFFACAVAIGGKKNSGFLLVAFAHPCARGISNLFAVKK